MEQPGLVFRHHLMPFGESTHLPLHALPADPRQRVIALFPHLPAYALEGGHGAVLVARINEALETRHSKRGSEAGAAAETILHELGSLDEALGALLASDDPSFSYEGAAVKGKDLLANISGGALPSPGKLFGGPAAAGGAGIAAGKMAPAQQTGAAGVQGVGFGADKSAGVSTGQPRPM